MIHGALCYVRFILENEIFSGNMPDLPLIIKQMLRI